MRKRILKNYVMTVAAAVAATMLLTTLLTYNLFTARMKDDMRLECRMTASLIAQGGTQAIEALGDAVRVTLIAPDGTVTFDSAADGGQMDSHADRPEVIRARSVGEGSAIRRSDTLSMSAFYYAERLEDGSVLRISKEAENFLSVCLRYAPFLLVLMLALVALIAWLADMLTRRIVAPIEGMADDLKSGRGAAVYPELEPFIRMIDGQHEEIMRNANMRVEFTANVSHELKTPLTSISGYAELIESGMAQGEMVKRFAGEINKSANRLLTLINDIIRLSQMDAPEREVIMQRVELDAAARTVVEQLQQHARRHEVELTLDAGHAVVNADPRMMEELIYNLCDNAIRYNVRGGVVRVRVAQEDGHVVLRVSDTGIGIGREHIERIFERFYRVDKSRSKATGGTGLGLAIVKHIAVRHGAQIAVSSEPGRGTVITVTFDLCSAQEGEQG